MTTISKNTVTLGGRKFKFAAFTFRQLDDHKEAIDLLMTAAGMNFSNADGRKAVVRVALASMQTAGESVDEAFLLDSLDISNFREIVLTLFDANGFVDKDESEGEVQAAALPS